MKGFPFFIIQQVLFLIWSLINIYGGLKIQTFNFVIFSLWRSMFNPLFLCVVKRCCGTRFFFTLSGLGFCISELYGYGVLDHADALSLDSVLGRWDGWILNSDLFVCLFVCLFSIQLFILQCH